MQFVTPKSYLQLPTIFKDIQRVIIFISPIRETHQETRKEHLHKLCTEQKGRKERGHPGAQALRDSEEQWDTEGEWLWAGTLVPRETSPVLCLKRWEGALAEAEGLA